VTQAVQQPVSITVRHSPILKVEGISQGGRFEVPAGCTVGSLLERLGIPANQQRYLIVYANGGKKTSSYVLRQDDAIQLFLPIGGG
jgi:sulfur carrier protein ThiS